MEVPENIVSKVGNIVVATGKMVGWIDRKVGKGRGIDKALGYIGANRFLHPTSRDSISMTPDRGAL